MKASETKQQLKEMSMALNPLEFMEIIEQTIGFTDEDKSILKSQGDWGRKIAPEMADKFYKY
ncbi:MAG TPA: hypothetical protein V6D33_15610, partial [Cyanophyceae cyanobacterium]